MQMCRCRQRGIRNYEQEAYQFWKKWVLGILAAAVLVGLAALKVYYLHQHFNERYTRYHEQALHNKTQGEDLVRGSCQGKPPDYRMAALDCSWAHQMNAIDPHYSAFALAVDHLFEDHLSILSLLGGCHDGICNSFLWMFAEKVLNNYHFTVLMITTTVCVICVAFIYSGFNFYRAHKDQSRIAYLASNEPRTQQEAQVYNALKDAPMVRELIQAGKRDEAVKQLAQLTAVANSYSKHAAEMSTSEHVMHLD